MENITDNNKLYNQYSNDLEKKRDLFLKKLDDIKTLDLPELIDKKKDKEERKNLYDAIKHNTINSNYFTQQDKQINEMLDTNDKVTHYILVAISFLLILICGKIGFFIIFEIILALFYPYVYIPVKIVVCHKYIAHNCTRIYNVINQNLN